MVASSQGNNKAANQPREGACDGMGDACRIASEMKGFKENYNATRRKITTLSLAEQSQLNEMKCINYNVQ